MHRLKPYPAYKHANVEWLDRVPVHWQLRANRTLLELRKRLVGEQSGDFTLLSLTLRGVIKRDMENPTGKFPASFDTYQSVEPGDLVFCLFDIEETPRCVGLSPFPGMVTGAYTVFEPSDSRTARYLYLYYLALDEVKALKPAYTGLRNTIQKSRFMSIKTPYPPLDEQRAIADFLDGMDARITRFIAARRKMIALLEEKKQAVINQAVTRGLDLDVPMKDSGVDWLGEIPAHWESPVLRYLGTKFGSGVTPRGGATTYVSQGVMLLRSQNVHFDGLRLDDVAHISDEVDEGMANSRVIPGDVLLNITGASLGRVCAVPETIGRANVNQHVCIIRPIQRRVLPEYLASYLRSTPTQLLIKQVSTGAAREGLTLDDMKPITVPLPPLAEQEQIVAHVNAEVLSVNGLIARQQREIELIQEYRTRLISDVVTGKLDVRGLELPAVVEFIGEEIEAAMEDEPVGEDEMSAIEA